MLRNIVNCDYKSLQTYFNILHHEENILRILPVGVNCVYRDYKSTSIHMDPNRETAFTINTTENPEELRNVSAL